MGAGLSKEVEKIEKKKGTAADFSNRGVSSVPADIGKLVSLKRLNLSNNKVRVIRFLISNFYRFQTYLTKFVIYET